MKLTILIAIFVAFTCLFVHTTEAATTSFNTNLSFRGAQSAAEVAALQQFLKHQGLYTADITGNFFTQTYNAVIAFQNKEGIMPASGFWGPLTRAKANQIVSTTAVAPTTSNSSNLTSDSSYEDLLGQLASAWMQVQRIESLIAHYHSPTPAPTAPAVTPTIISTPTPTPATNSTTVTTTVTLPITAPSISAQNAAPAKTKTVTPVTTPTTTNTPPVTPPSTTPTTTTAPSTSSSGISWGVYAGDDVSSLAGFESLVGSKPSLSANFVSWDDSFPTAIAAPVCAAGQTQVIFWENYDHSLDNIISGQYDSYIQTFATAAQSYGCPIIISLFHEMNGNWDDWDGTVGDNSPAKIIAAWKHVHDLFATATNVKWAFVVNSDSVPDTAANSIAAYYPGSSYVDYVGIDGFNFGNPWQSFSDIFSSALSQLSGYGKPVYIFSMASAAGSNKAAWITDAIGTQIPADGVSGWIWFNQNKEQNWTVNSDPASLAAFKAVLGG